VEEQVKRAVLLSSSLDRPLDIIDGSSTKVRKLLETGGHRRGHQNETNLDPNLYLNDLRSGREVELVHRGSGIAIGYRGGD